MTLSVNFNARIDFPKVVPVLGTIPPEWDLERAGSLARTLGTRAKVVDAGPWYIARDERLAVEVYQGSNSFRFTRRDVDGEARDGTDGAPDRDTAIAIAQEWLAPYLPADAEVDIDSVTEREILVATRDEREPKQLLAGLDVNVRFAHRGFALLGSGAKAKVAVRRDGSVSEAYRFWRDLAPNGEATTRSLDELYERFSASDLFADLTDNSARAEVVSARFGYLTLPPTEPMPELSPVLELQGTLETEHQRYDFTRYVAAVAPGDRDRDRKVTNAHPALVIV